ncbi:MAG: 16S rRNA (guanine(527)-N(7))-methyltransferase RsmG [Marinilabiliaceae bacterium]|nr:16S rRNA (guanine(527)-N(7))-methyltransferase RsmG [Marinilabiliaceae bacterium]
MESIKKYFPEFTKEQINSFSELPSLYAEWNAKINVISRKDLDFFTTHHLLHSLAIARCVFDISKDSKGFPAGSSVIDIGTGGGLPGIPLAIAFPDVHFTLMDSIGKKIKVVEGISSALGLQNVEPVQARSTDIHDKKWNYIVSRAVTAFPDFVKQTRHLLLPPDNTSDFDFILPQGTYYLKGGDFLAETNPFGSRVKIIEIKDWFKEDFFDTKRIIFLKA